MGCRVGVRVLNKPIEPAVLLMPGAMYLNISPFFGSFTTYGDVIQEKGGVSESIKLCIHLV